MNSFRGNSPIHPNSLPLPYAQRGPPVRGGVFGDLAGAPETLYPSVIAFRVLWSSHRNASNTSALACVTGVPPVYRDAGVTGQ